MKSNFAALLYTTVLVAGVCARNQALAQASQPEGTGSAVAAGDNSATRMDEIVVTAQRREERIEDVPVSIVSQTAEQLQNANITDTMDLSRVVPGLLMTRVGAPAAPAIRGVSTKVVSPGSDPNVSTYLDGFYQVDPIALNRTLLDVTNVEVLRGPQGTLFGRNSTGGSILLDTEKPSHDPVLRIREEGEQDNGFRSALYGSVGLTDIAAVSLTAAYGTSDGWIRNVAPGYEFPTAPTDSRYLRPRFLIEPVEHFSIDISYEHGDMQDGTGTAFAFTAHPAIPGVAPILSPSSIETFLNQQDKVRDEWNAGYLTLSWDLGWAVAKSMTHARESGSPWDFDLDGSPLTLIHVVNNNEEHTQTEELNLTSEGDERLNWIVGAYYFNDFAAERVNTFNLHYGNKTKAWALYGDVTYSPIDKVFLTAGVRYTEEEKDCLDAPDAINGGGTLAPCTAGGGDPVLHERTPTPRAVARYELTPQSNVYLSFSRGFKSGGFNDGMTVPYSPETITDWEIGFKTVRDRYRLDLSAFHYDYNNLQFSYACAVAAPPICPAAGGTVTINAASATSYGGEVQFSWLPIEQLSFNGGLAYLHARYDRFLNAAATAPTTATSVPSCTNANAIQCGNIAVPQDWTGQQLIRAPNLSGNLGFTGRLPTNVGTFELDGNASYTSRYQSDTDSLACTTVNCGRGLEPRLSVPPYALVDVTLSWTDSKEHFGVGVYVRNLFDKSYIISTDANTFGDFVVGGEPRIVGGRFTYRY